MSDIKRYRVEQFNNDVYEVIDNRHNIQIYTCSGFEAEIASAASRAKVIADMMNLLDDLCQGNESTNPDYRAVLA